MPTSLRIGICVRDRSQQHALQTLIGDCGHQLGLCVLQSELAGWSATAAPEVDAWIVLTVDEVNSPEVDDTPGNSTMEESLDNWLDGLEAPAIICEPSSDVVGSDEYLAWSRRLKGKLQQLEGTINLASQERPRASEVWVLAASTGGPSAVKDFLSELPPGLGIAFIYVQHINSGFDETLARAISKHSHYSAKLVVNGDVVEANRVLIVSPEKATEVLSNGTFAVNDSDWQAPYRPSVDCVVASVAWAYPNRCGVIVFTGMGDDGAASCRIMHQKGGRVWVQTPGSCTSDSMPQSVLEQGCVEFKGTPYALAQHLVQEVQMHRSVAAASPATSPLNKWAM